MRTAFGCLLCLACGLVAIAPVARAFSGAQTKLVSALRR